MNFWTRGLACGSREYKISKEGSRVGLPSLFLLLSEQKYRSSYFLVFTYWFACKVDTEFLEDVAVNFREHDSTVYLCAT